MSSRTYSTNISYDPRTSSSSVSSRGSSSYDYRVPSSGYGGDKVTSVTRNGVQVINHKQRSSDSSAPRSSDAYASRYYDGSSYRR
ncbi:hypothetical protein V492_06380 [Pseudogymnoascus sp. VKM F-4246]|nr:hypothetical protein V492_06380 [Pseudogymnoascus sp. VKM F-4246]